MNPTAALAALGVAVACCGVIGVIAAAKGVRITPRRPTGMPTRLSKEHWIILGLSLAVMVITRLPILALCVAAGAWFIPSLWSDQGTSARLLKLRGLASWARTVADRLNSGAAVTLEQALVQACHEPPAGIAVAARKLGTRLGAQSAGAWGTEKALRAFADDLNDQLCDRVIGALILRHRNGGKGLKTVMASLVASIDRSVSREDEILTDHNKSRSDARTIALFLLAFVAILVMYPGSPVMAYATPMGQLFLTIPVGLIVLGLWRMKSLSAPVPSPRILNKQESPS